MNGGAGKRGTGPASPVFGARAGAAAGAGEATSGGGGGLPPEHDPGSDHDHHAEE